MKKIMSLLLAGIMLFGLIPAMAVTAIDDVVDESLVFDIDLSRYDATLEDDATKGITNKVEGGGSTIEVNGAPVASVIGDFTTKKALTFKDADNESGTNTNGIKVIDADFLGNDEMTFEFWAKGTELGTTTKGIYRLFTMSGDASYVDTYGNSGTIWWRPGGEAKYEEMTDYRYAATDYADTDGEWAHYVFTRQWTPAAENDGTGTWSGDLYINGAKVTASRIEQNGKTVTRKTESENTVLALGNNGSCNQGFYGSIADVRVYNSILTDATIAQKYAETFGEFVQFEHTGAKAGVRTLAKTEEAQELDVKAGTIELEFTEPVADADLDKILFTKSNGDPIEGVYTVTKSGAKAIVSYPALELGANYRLIIPNDLTAALGEPIKTGATYIFTAVVDEKLVFDLDLTNFNAAGTGAKGIVNTVEGGNSTITVSGAPVEATIGDFNPKKVLDFTPTITVTPDPETGGDKTTFADTNRGIKVEDDDFLSQDEMTLEFWVKGTEFGTGVPNGSYRLFSMATGNGSDTVSVIDIFVYNGRIYYRPGGTGAISKEYKQADFTAYDEKWTHFVFTRKWNPSATTEGVGTWSGDLYINGTKNTNFSTNGTITEQAKRTEEGAFVGIGNKAQFDNGFRGSVGDVKIYNSILSDDSIVQKYEDTVGDYYPFTAGDVKLGGTTLTETQEIDYNPGELVLEFSEPVAEEELDKITFKKAADGAAIKGVCIKEVSGKNVTIKYGRLEDDVTYTLTIPTGLKSKLGEELSAGKTYNLTAKKTYLYTEDFSGNTVPSGQSADGTQWLEYQSNSSTTNDISAMSMASTADGDGYLSVKPGATDAVGKDYSVSVKWKNAIDYATADTNTLYVIESQISSVHTEKPGVDQSKPGRVARDFYNLNNAFRLGEYHYDNVNLYKDRNVDTGVGSGANGYFNPDKDEDGFTNMRFVLKNYQIAADTTGLGYEMHDLNDPQRSYISFIPSKKYIENTTNANAYPKKFTKLKLSHIFTQAADTYDAELRYSDIKVYTRPCTEVLDISEYNELTRTVDVALTSDISDTEKENIVVLDSLGNEVENITRTYNAATRTVTLAFGSAAGDDYTVSLENVRDTDGFMCTQEVVAFSATEPYAVVEYLDGDDQELATLEGATEVKATAVLKNWENAAPIAIFAVYDNNCLVGTSIGYGTVSGNVFNYSMSVSGISALTKNAEVKLFMWKNLSNIAPALETDDFTGGSL